MTEKDDELQKASEDEHQKEMIKAAFMEWLDDQVRAFGWFSIKWLTGVVIGGVLIVWLSTHGWKAPPIIAP